MSPSEGNQTSISQLPTYFCCRKKMITKFISSSVLSLVCISLAVNCGPDLFVEDNSADSKLQNVEQKLSPEMQERINRYKEFDFNEDEAKAIIAVAVVQGILIAALSHKVLKNKSAVKALDALQGTMLDAELPSQYLKHRGKVVGYVFGNDSSNLMRKNLLDFGLENTPFRKKLTKFEGIYFPENIDQKIINKVRARAASRGYFTKETADPRVFKLEKIDKNQRYLLIVPNSGFSNRMKVLMNGKALAKKTNRKLVIAWDLKPGDVPARYTDIFDDPDVVVLNKLAGEKFGYSYKWWNKFEYSPLGHGIKEAKFEESLLGDKKMVKLMSNDWYFGNDVLSKENIKGEMIEYLKTKKFSKSVREKIDKFAEENFTDYTVGIHFRGFGKEVGDDIPQFAHLKRYTPEQAAAELFIPQMRKVWDEAKSEGKNIRFFIATDKVEIRQLLVNEFGEKNVVYVKDMAVGRETPEDFLRSLEDIGLLEKTKKIYGTNGSTFSDLPAYVTESGKKYNVGLNAYSGGQEANMPL